MYNIEKLDPKKLGVVLVDLQRGYCDPTSDCAEKLGWDVSDAEKVCHGHVPFLFELRKILPPQKIIWIKSEERLDSILPNLCASSGFLCAEEELCVRNTPGHDYYIVAPNKNEPEFLKFHPNCFSSSEFVEHLSKHKITQLAFTGVIGSRCVNSAIISASERGFECIAVMDLIGGPEKFKDETECHMKVTTHLYAWPLQSNELTKKLMNFSRPVGIASA